MLTTSSRIYGIFLRREGQKVWLLQVEGSASDQDTLVARIRDAIKVAVGQLKN